MWTPPQSIYSFRFCSKVVSSPASYGVYHVTLCKAIYIYTLYYFGGIYSELDDSSTCWWPSLTRHSNRNISFELVPSEQWYWHPGAPESFELLKEINTRKEGLVQKETQHATSDSRFKIILLDFPLPSFWLRCVFRILAFFELLAMSHEGNPGSLYLCKVFLALGAPKVASPR